MSRAFTKEDDNASFEKPASSKMRVSEPFHLTAAGAALMRSSSDEQLQAALAFAEVLPLSPNPQRAALGVTVRVRDEEDCEHDYLLVSPTEFALTRVGASIEGPIGRALLGAEVGDVREVRLPRGVTELAVIALS